jgi:uncharacterized membrane protein
MNDAHLHLAFNHFPLIVPIVGILILIVGSFSDSEAIRRVALGVFVFGAIMTFPVMYSGEGAEEIAEKIPGITKQMIHEHEERAETFAILSYILGLISLVGLWASLKQKSYAHYIAMAAVIMGVVTIYFGKQTGTSGGEIRHTEIRANGDASQNAPVNTPDEDND